MLNKILIYKIVLMRYKTGMIQVSLSAVHWKQNPRRADTIVTSIYMIEKKNGTTKRAMIVQCYQISAKQKSV